MGYCSTREALREVTSKSSSTSTLSSKGKGPQTGDQVGRVFRRVAPTAQVAALRAVLDLRGAGGDDVVPNTSSFSSLCFCLLWVTVVSGVAGRATHLRVGNPDGQLGATGPLLAAALLDWQGRRCGLAAGAAISLRRNAGQTAGFPGSLVLACLLLLPACFAAARR